MGKWLAGAAMTAALLLVCVVIDLDPGVLALTYVCMRSAGVDV